jgi:hypothetical protein
VQDVLLPREAMFVALPCKVDTMLRRFDAGHEHGKPNHYIKTKRKNTFYIFNFNDLTF